MASLAFVGQLGQPYPSSTPLAASGSPPAVALQASAPQHGAGRVSGPHVSSVFLAKALVGLGLAVRGLRQRRVARTVRRAVGTVPKASGLLIQPDDCQELIRQSRPAHWVIRASDLKKTLKFLVEVFEMKVLRHEEFDQPCAISCNGTFDTPWSKTMVGFEREDQGFCLELTYNYGIPEYITGNGLAHIAVGVEIVDSVLTAAVNMGYSVDGDMVTGPDDYKFRVLAQQPERQERFQYVALRVANASKAAEFYEQCLGMEEFSGEFAHITIPGTSAEQTRVVGYSSAQVPLLLFEDEAVQVIRLEQWEGRNALAVPGRALRAVYQRVVEDGHGGAMLHPIREFNEHPMLRRKRGLPPMPCEPSPEEQLRALREDPSSAPQTGTLTVAVVTDADGYEICLVSSETYDAAVAKAYDPEGKIDWAWRGEAIAGRRTPTPIHMVACI
eukprot:CAMPEP_0195068660 /NCGR_PEP_ID=MMETSP0448-20130528/13281_1 /TAXON_ID=66468 /ORGANISM="Heterocapsa triquestra, Strain CCMP 448" /LENGTH=442 /DNA_ID=CAMNT_0040100201 /DNA_START=55 /DNA_END=1383 /DNA_ORIENTATION=+